MITIDTSFLTSSTSFYYLLEELKKKYGYGSSNVNQTNGTSNANATAQANSTTQTDETSGISETEAKQLLDYEQLIEDLKLNLPENRFALLLLFPRAELFKIIEYLEKENLLNGLKFFTKEKLMNLIGSLISKQDLLKMLFKMFTDKSQLIENLPKKELDRFLRSDQVEKGFIMNAFELMPKENLAVIAGYLTRQDCSKMKKSELLAAIQPFKKFHIVDGIMKLDEASERNLITLMTDSQPKLYNEFSHLALFNVTEKFAKTDIIESMTVIDTAKITDMLSELPDKLVALTASQIDPEIFAKLLLSNYKDILAELVLG